MLKTIPHVAAESCFALKGGTAINLFVRDMPRLSVDIDLAYLPVDERRETALKKSSEALGRIAAAIKKTITGTRVQESRAREPDRVIRLIVSTGATRIKIEPNEVIRGSVFPSEEQFFTVGTSCRHRPGRIAPQHARVQRRDSAQEVLLRRFMF